MKTKIPSEVLKFINNHGTSLYNGKKYCFFPFWLEVVNLEEGICIFHTLESLPEDLKETIATSRGIDYKQH